jgi:integrase
VDELAAALEAHRQTLLLQQHRGLTGGWVFPAKTGGPHPNSVLRKAFKDLLGHLGITKRFTPHGLRRTSMI